jgi:hypothetical protein
MKVPILSVLIDNLSLADKTAIPNLNDHFNVCFNFTLGQECSPNNYKSDTLGDAGGRTVCGLCVQSEGQAMIDQMWNMNYNDAVAFAKKVYYENYWLPIHGGMLIDPHYAVVVFDCAINNGVGIANRLQILCTTVDTFCDARIQAIKGDYPNGYILDKGLKTERDIVPELIARVERTRAWTA